MKTKRLLSATIMLIAALTLYANPRSKKTMERAAAEVLNSSISNNGIKRSPRKEKLVELQSNDVVTIMGYQSGGYAIMGNDDRLPLIIGYSDTKFVNDTLNLGFQWYIKAITSSNNTRILNNIKSSTIKPDPKQFSTRVNPLIRTKWGQTYPYNNLCPIINDNGKRAVTGCVATAIAQIVYYNHFPIHGLDKDCKITYKVNNTKKDTIINFGKNNYQYSSMLLDYNGKYTEKNVNSVAELMFDCGLISSMSYSENASGASHDACRDGLSLYFCYGNKLKKKLRYQENNGTWMNLIFKELNEGRPILYTGTNKNKIGHAFILDGYDENGNIHINWGWNGQGNGYFNLSVLDSTSIDFYKEQEMTLNFVGYSDDWGYDTVHVEKPGTLSSLIPLEETSNFSNIKITGKINSDDFRYIRKLAGRDENNNYVHTLLRVLDLKDADIVDGGSPYYYLDNKSYTTKANSISDYAFYNCKSLSRIILPESLESIGEHSFTNLSELDSIYFGKNFPVYDGGVYNKDTTVLYKVYTSKENSVNVYRNTSSIEDYAFKGCNKLERINIYKNVRSIGNEAFAQLTKLKEIWNMSNRETFMGTDVYKGINKDCYLHNSYSFYNLHNFPGHTLRWGIEVSPDKDEGSYHIVYGEDFSKAAKYEVKAYDVPDSLIKRIKVTSNATSSSPCGIYDVIINESDPIFDSIPIYNKEPTFKLLKREATLKADTCFVLAGTNIYDYKFTYTIDGLVNDEKEIPSSDWLISPYLTVYEKRTHQPIYTFEEGKQYEIKFDKNCSSRNYTFKFINGVAIVRSTNDIKKINDVYNHENKALYDLSGRIAPPNYKGIIVADGKKILNR